MVDINKWWKQRISRHEKCMEIRKIWIWRKTLEIWIKFIDRIGGMYGDRVGVRISGDDGQILKTKEWMFKEKKLGDTT